MNALVVHPSDPSTFGISRVPIPLPSQFSDSVVFEPLYNAVSGTDAAVASGRLPQPVTYGFQAVGCIRQDSLSENVSNTVFAVDPAVPCDRPGCADCAAGETNLCTSTICLGMVGAHGTFGHLISVPRKCLIPLHPSTPPDLGTFASPLAVAAEAVAAAVSHLASRRPRSTRKRLTVIGTGQVAMCVLLCIISRAGQSLTATVAAAALAAPRAASAMEVSVAEWLRGGGEIAVVYAYDEHATQIDTLVRAATAHRGVEHQAGRGGESGWSVQCVPQSAALAACADVAAAAAEGAVGVGGVNSRDEAVLSGCDGALVCAAGGGRGAAIGARLVRHGGVVVSVGVPFDVPPKDLRTAAAAAAMADAVRGMSAIAPDGAAGVARSLVCKPSDDYGSVERRASTTQHHSFDGASPKAGKASTRAFSEQFDVQAARLQAAGEAVAFAAGAAATVAEHTAARTSESISRSMANSPLMLREGGDGATLTRGDPSAGGAVGDPPLGGSATRQGDGLRSATTRGRYGGASGGDAFSDFSPDSGRARRCTVDEQGSERGSEDGVGRDDPLYPLIAAHPRSTPLAPPAPEPVFSHSSGKVLRICGTAERLAALSASTFNLPLSAAPQVRPYPAHVATLAALKRLAVISVFIHKRSTFISAVNALRDSRLCLALAGLHTHRYIFPPSSPTAPASFEGVVNAFAGVSNRNAFGAPVRGLVVCGSAAMRKNLQLAQSLALGAVDLQAPRQLSRNRYGLYRIHSDTSVADTVLLPSDGLFEASVAAWWRSLALNARGGWSGTAGADGEAVESPFSWAKYKGCEAWADPIGGPPLGVRPTKEIGEPEAPLLSHHKRYAYLQRLAGAILDQQEAQLAAPDPRRESVVSDGHKDFTAQQWSDWVDPELGRLLR